MASDIRQNVCSVSSSLPIMPKRVLCSCKDRGTFTRCKGRFYARFDKAYDCDPVNNKSGKTGCTKCLPLVDDKCVECVNGDYKRQVDTFEKVNRDRYSSGYCCADHNRNGCEPIKVGGGGKCGASTLLRLKGDIQKGVYKRCKCVIDAYLAWAHDMNISLSDGTTHEKNLNDLGVSWMFPRSCDKNCKSVTLHTEEEFPSLGFSESGLA